MSAVFIVMPSIMTVKYIYEHVYLPNKAVKQTERQITYNRATQYKCTAIKQ